MKVDLKWVLLILALSFAGMAYLNHKAGVAQSALVEANLSKDSLTKLKNGQSAIIAGDKIQKDSLSAALDAERQTNSRLVAAIRIRGKQPIIIDSVKTGTVFSDSTRTLNVRDSTSGGVLTAKVTAPPFPGQLAMNYTYVPNPFDVTVSLLQLKDNTAVFAVKYNGGTTQVSASYANLVAPPRSIIGYAEGLYDPFNRNFLARVGVNVRVPFTQTFFLAGEAEQRFVNNGGSLLFGLRKTF